MRFIKPAFVICYLLFTSCIQKNFQTQKLIGNEEVLNILISKGYFEFQNEIQVDGRLENERLIISYFSVTQEEYFEAFKNNQNHIDFFGREFRVNEQLKSGSERKDDTLLVINTDLKDLIFKDYKEKSIYFYEDKVENLHVVKGYQFEDAYSYFIDSSTGEIVDRLWGTQIKNFPGDNLFLYSDGIIFDYDQLTEVAFLESNYSGIDTLLTVDNQWIAKNAFFSKQNEVFYIHTDYSNGIFKSSYAKMEIRKK